MAHGSRTLHKFPFAVTNSLFSTNDLWFYRKGTRQLMCGLGDFAAVKWGFLIGEEPWFWGKTSSIEVWKWNTLGFWNFLLVFEGGVKPKIWNAWRASQMHSPTSSWRMNKNISMNFPLVCRLIFWDCGCVSLSVCLSLSVVYVCDVWFNVLFAWQGAPEPLQVRITHFGTKSQKTTSNLCFSISPVLINAASNTQVQVVSHTTLNTQKLHFYRLVKGYQHLIARS